MDTPILETKECKKCHDKKHLDCFYKDKVGKFGNPNYIYYRNICRECDRKEKIEYRKLDKSKEIRRKYEKIYYKNRRKVDPFFKLRKDIPSIIRRSIKKNYSGDSIWNYLPYTPSQLKEHLEKQFDQNMSWDNHGNYWHIDHIKPQVLLKYDSVSHPNFLICWSLDNLKPLKVEDNLKKSSFFNGKNYRNLVYITK